ncbi:hypothetical protein Dimus_028253 [Dionaea muscipula]
MFKVQRWRNEKIKTVFRLQFQATQMTDSGSWIMLSVVPADVGQPTARLGKVLVQDGACTWENPIYETVKFIREPRTGNIQDKIYHFILATGSPKKCLLGEVSINFADYIEALRVPAAISLPVKGSSSNAILHVNIQNLQGTNDTRETEEKREQRVKPGVRTLHSPTGDRVSDGSDRRSSPVEDDEGSSDFIDNGTLNSILAPRSLLQKKMPEAATEKRHTEEQREEDATFLQYKNHYTKRTNDSDTFPRESEQAPSDTSIEELKKEIFTLKRQGDMMRLELESLRRQVVKESKRGQELSRKIISLTEERNALKLECETLQLFRNSNSNDNGLSARKETETRSQVKEIEEELAQEKDPNEGLKMQLRKTQDSGTELILVVNDPKEMLHKSNNDYSHLPADKQYCMKYGVSVQKDSEEKPDKDKHLLLEDPISQGNDNGQVIFLREKIKSLQHEIEHHMKDKKEQDKQIRQLVEDYEISEQKCCELQLKFEQNHEQLVEKEHECKSHLGILEDHEGKIARLEKLIKNQEEECLEASKNVHMLEGQVKSLKQELKKQAHGYEADICEMAKSKVEQEQKVLKAQEELKQIKLNYAAAAKQLQEDFGKLSEDIVSKLNENEKLTVKAQCEANNLRLQINALQKDLQKANNEITSIKHLYDLKVQNLIDQLLVQKKESGQSLLKLKDEYTELKCVKQKAEEKSEFILKENQMLVVEVERLSEKNDDLSKQLEQANELRSEMKWTKRSMDDTSKLLEVTIKERDDLERNYASLRMEATRSQEELNNTRLLQEEKEATTIKSLKSEIEALEHQHGKLKNNLLEEKLEDEKLKKKVIEQKEVLLKRDIATTCREEKFKSTNFREEAHLKEKSRKLKADKSFGSHPENSDEVEERSQQLELWNSGMSLQNEANISPWKSSRRDVCKEKSQKVPASQIKNEDHLTHLLTEVTTLKEKNKSMEDELKEMQEKYSTVSLKFAEVEGERQQLVMTIRNLRNGQKIKI